MRVMGKNAGEWAGKADDNGNKFSERQKSKAVNGQERES